MLPVTSVFRYVCLMAGGMLLWFEHVRPAKAEPPPAMRRINITDRLPYGHRPIDYSSPATNDAVVRLNRRLKAGRVRLNADDRHGYLPALLKALKIPVESQLLVFSKTALHPRLVTPNTPRAIYFNDEAAVAWVPGSSAVEVMAVDPLKGVNFYTLKQRGKPRFVREDRCLACHAGTTTLQVPGWMVRSFHVTDTGQPISGYSRITHNTHLKKRWGGWYVSGVHGQQPHRGNIAGKRQNTRFRRNPGFAGNVTQLKQFLDVSRFLSPHSDIAAHLVLNHQAHGVNLITRVGYETRLNRTSDAEERLLRYLLFVDEAPLTFPVTGTSGYRKWFEQQGPFDSHGRSLRQFDLKTRLFKYRLSYLIYSPLFDGLPKQVKARLYKRLWDILTGESPQAPFNTIPKAERRAIVEILRDTKRNLPSYWRATR